MLSGGFGGADGGSGKPRRPVVKWLRQVKVMGQVVIQPDWVDFGGSNLLVIIDIYGRGRERQASRNIAGV